MLKASSLVLLVLLALPCLPAEGPDHRLHFRTYGFSIAPLEGVSKATHQTLMMFLPPSQGFAPNVNVLIQPFDGTIKDYAEASRVDLAGRGFTIKSEKEAGDSLQWEYTGTLEGRPLHWYSKAELADGRVHLVTATALDAQWEGVGGQLKACVDSFKREAPAEAPAPPR